MNHVHHTAFMFLIYASSGYAMEWQTKFAIDLSNHGIPVTAIEDDNPLDRLVPAPYRAKRAVVLSGSVSSVAFSPDGTLLATGSQDGTARIWDIDLKAYIELRHYNSVYSMAFSPDGTRLATGSGDGTARVWDIDLKTCIKKLKRHRHAVLSVVFSPDGKRLITGSRNGTARVWDIDSKACIKKLKGDDGQVRSMTFSPNGTLLAIGSRDNAIRVWVIDSKECISELKGDECEVNSMAFSPDSKQLATGSWYETTYVWDNVDEDAYVNNRKPNVECIKEPWDWKKASSEPVNSVAFSPDGTLLATGSNDGIARVWDLDLKACIKKLMHFGVSNYMKRRVNLVAFSPDGKLLATGSEDGAVCVWRLDWYKKLREALQTQDKERTRSKLWAMRRACVYAGIYHALNPESMWVYEPIEPEEYVLRTQVMPHLTPEQQEAIKGCERIKVDWEKENNEHE